MPSIVLAPSRSVAVAIGMAAAVAAAIPIATAQEVDLEPGHSLLRRVAEAYKALPGYADAGSVTLSFEVAGEVETQTLARPFAFARPGRLAVSFEPAQFVVDGRRQVSSIAGLYLEAEAPGAITDAVLARDPAASYIFGGLPGIPSMTLFRLLGSDDPYSAILQGVERLEREPERTVDGVSCRSLRIVPQSGPIVRLLIDPSSSLIRRIEVIPTSTELPQDVQVKEISWSSGEILAAVPSDDRFAFRPAEGAKRVNSVAALIAGGDGEEPGAELVGTPVADFAIDLLATEGAVDRMSRADLAGKVVLIDAWATWCVPCGPELKAVEELVDRLADAPGADRLLVISLNIDTPPPADAPEPGAEAAAGAGGEGDGESGDAKATAPGPRPAAEVVRELVDGYVARAGLRLDRPPVARIAIDPDGEATEALGIQALPMLLLIDPQGIVRAVHAGAPPRVIRELAPTIEAMLAAEAGPRGDAPTVPK